MKRPVVGNRTEQLLDCLKRVQGRWLSGESLSQEMQMSRTAVWKHVGALKSEGYLIASSPRKGYRLQEIPDRLLPWEVRDGLQTGRIGRGEIRHFPRLASTNLEAKSLAAAGAPEGTLVIAEEQTAGRGRLGRSWFSPPGGIYLSLIIRPDIQPDEAPRFALLTAAAVAAALRKTTLLEVRIKWPNDLLVQGGKLGGILTEIGMEMDRVEYMVVGLGVNVNLVRKDFPPELQPLATSIRAETGRTFPRLLLLRRILEEFEAAYDEYRREGFAPVRRRWQTFAEMTGRRVTVRSLGETFTGEALDIDADGFLVLREEHRGTMRFFSGDVSYV